MPRHDPINPTIRTGVNCCPEAMAGRECFHAAEYAAPETCAGYRCPNAPTRRDGLCEDCKPGYRSVRVWDSVAV